MNEQIQTAIIAIFSIALIGISLYALVIYLHGREITRFRRRLAVGQSVQVRKGQFTYSGKLVSRTDSACTVKLGEVNHFVNISDIYPPL